LPEVNADFRRRCYAAPPSIGAFEAEPPEPEGADSDEDQLPDAWEDEHLLDKHDPGDASLDPDSDGHDNLQEYTAGTNPRQRTSVLRILSSEALGDWILIRFSSGQDREYWVEGSNSFDRETWSRRALYDADKTEKQFLTDLTPTESRFFRIRGDWDSARDLGSAVPGRRITWR
jgi:hypothetical protein